MSTQENNQEVVVDTTNNEAEGSEVETISVPKRDYDKLNETIGSMKRELKDLKKPKETTKETKETAVSNQPEQNQLIDKLERMSLRQAGITHTDDIELARKTAKKWGVDIDEVLSDDDFKVKLERLQSERSNVEATSGVKGGAGKSQAKNTAEYWKAKGTRPTPADVPDRKTRTAIIRTLMDSSKNNKKFYSD